WPRALAQRVQSFRRGLALKQRRWRFRPLVEILEDRRLLATFVVTTTADALIPPVGSLREAINSANSNPGADTITFDLPLTTTIAPVAALPDIVDRVTIDGENLNALGGHVILDGSGAGSANGLVLTSSFSGFTLLSTSSGSIIRGLVIENFQGAG